MKLFNLKCQDEENIYNVTLEAPDIDKAVEIAWMYLEEHNLEPIAIWRCNNGK